MNVRWLTLLPAMMIMSTFSGSMVRGEDALSSRQSTAQHSGSALPSHIAERRASIVRLIEAEAKRHELPPELVDAVVFVESAYDPAAIGNSGEIGLMQVLPSTAAMLGFLGSSAQLSDPEMNVRYGVLYLSKAWRMTGGDVCRTVVKYRAGLGESAITTRSAEYCRRVRGHLAQIGSSLATAASLPVGAAGSDAVIPDMPLAEVNVVGKTSVRGPILRGSAFWLAHKARIRSLTDKVHKKWQRLARH